MDYSEDGLEELPHARSQGQSPRGATACPRSGGCVGKEGREELLSFKVRRGGREEIPLKEQQLCFAGGAVKRYPTPR